MKTARNFLLANLCAVLPLWWALFAWMPDQVRMYMRGMSAPGTIVANGTALAGEDLGEWPGGRVFRFYLRKDMKWNALAFRLPAGLDGVERIELQKWKLMAFRKQGTSLVPSGGMGGEYVFASPGLGRIGVAAGKITLGLALLELALLGVSWWFARRHRPERWKTLLPPVLGVALALTLLMQVALPVQSYLANQSSYPFSTGNLLGAVAVRFAWFFLLAVAAVGLLVRHFGRWVLGVAFAWAVCVYLESGILSNDLSSLNGDIWTLLNPARALWDAAAWAGVFAFVAGTHVVLRKHYGLAALCLIIMLAASLLDVKRVESADKSGLIVDDFVPFGEVIRNVTYSTNRNVLVFILDSLECEQAHAIMEDPEAGAGLREAFRGFTEYTNNVGALPTTLAAVPNLLTGRYPDGTASMSAHAWSCYAEDSAVNVFLQAGQDVYLTTPGLGCGYASKRKSAEEREGRKRSVLRQRGEGGEAWSVMDFTRWRWLPFAAKASCMELTGLANSSVEQREWAVFPELSRAPIAPESKGVFLLCHTEGVHVPIKWNRHGEMLAQQRQDNQACVEQGVLVLKCLAALMDTLRETGIYDNSLILVLGDHGKHSERDYLEAEQSSRLPKNARPCLWVKPVGSSHDFESSDAPTGHAQVAGLLKAAARGVLSETEIRDILEADERVYRRMALLGAGWTDWIVRRDGSFSVQTVHPVSPGQGQGRPLKCGHRYTLFWKAASQIDAELSFEGIAVDGFPVFPKDNARCTMGFRVPDAGKGYVLRLGLYDGEGGRLRFRCETPDADWEEFPVEPFARIDIRNVKSDATGMARVLCERAGGPDVDVAFTSLLLEEVR